MPWLLVPVGLGKVGPDRKISVANCGSSYLCFGLMSSYHAASSYFQAFLWWHRGRPACVYFTKYVTSNCLTSWECLCYGEGLCVCMLNTMVELGEGMSSHCSYNHSVLQHLQSGSIVAIPFYTNKQACLLSEIRGLSNGVTWCNVWGMWCRVLGCED